MYEYAKALEDLNADGKAERLEALRLLMKLEQQGIVAKPKTSGSVNNHIHTVYSFSPYSPVKALWMARSAGLSTAGIMDHDSVGGCDEFVKAGEIAGMATTCGFECRVSLKGTPFEGRRLNNPDQISIAYVALHGIPHQNFSMCEEFLAPYRAQRGIRNRKMTEKLNGVIAPLGLSLDYDRDILPLSRAGEGGSVTERHILFALAKKMVRKYAKGPALVSVLRQALRMEIPKKVEERLSDRGNPFYEYDLLGAMKGSLVSAFYSDADEECPALSDFISFAGRCGGISAYAYLGDVGESVTGDKKAQKFEDDFIEELFDFLEASGFNAVTYMPSRNTSAQLARVIELCEKHGLFQISGEDINTPRQSFICEAMNKPEFRHLSVSTWALIGHELKATRCAENAMFSEKTRKEFPELSRRIEHYAAVSHRAAEN